MRKRSWSSITARLRLQAWMTAAFVAGAPGPAAAQCVFANLQWNADGTRVQFDVTCGTETRRATVDVASGVVRVDNPRVQAPVRCTSRGTILFRDALGVLECAEEGAEPARLVLAAPENGTLFVRAYGEDARGRVLVWLYDRAGGRHLFVARDRTGDALPAEAQTSGPEAQRAWAARQRGTPFSDAGNPFRHTVCTMFRGRSERACVEPLTGVDDGSFRLTTGRPGAVAEWVTHVWPSGWSLAPDSSAVLVGLLETDNGALQCGTWIVGPERSRRVGQSRSAGRSQTGRESWVLWTDPSRAFWADATGALWNVDREAMTATLRLGGTGGPQRASTPPAAAGIVSPAVSGARGVRAWVQGVDTPDGVDCELWVDPGSGPRRVVAPLGPGLGP